MDRNASYMDACRLLSEEISSREKGSSYVLVAHEGYGENEVIAYLHSKLESEGIRFFRGSRYLKTELAKYHIFNEILNDAFDEFRNRDIEALMAGYTELLNENDDGSTVIVAEGLESVSEESRDFFLYLSRLTRKYNFKLLGTLTTSLMDSDGHSGRFLQILETESALETLHIDKMKIEDLKFFLETNGYNLPDRFLNDLFRLVDGNMSTLKYALKYYEDHGIINEKKEVDDVVYRFFPIPQGVEIYYDRVLNQLSEKQKFVAEILALIQEETTYRRISKLSGIDESETLNILSKLEKAGIVSESSLKYDISNYRIRDFILNRMSNTRKLEIYSALSASELFDDMPIQMQLNVLLQKGDYQKIGEYLEVLGRSVISKFSSLNSLINFLNEFSEKAEDKAHYYSAMMTKCDALERLGEPEKASSCYEGIIKEFPQEVSPRISLAKLKGDMGMHETALSILAEISPGKSLSEKDSGDLFLAKASILLKRREYAEALATAEKAIDILQELKDKAGEATALNLMGNVCLETFKHGEAMSHYEKALSINRELGLLSSAAMNLNNIAIAKSYFGDYDQSVSILHELIESSYLTGDIVTRAYATYNLAETYYIMGRMDDVRGYIPSSLKLVEVANRNGLKYRFYRFLSLYCLNELDISGALNASEKALEAVDNDMDGQLYKLAYAMRELYQELLTGEKSDILPNLLQEDFEEEEEFLPIFYTMGEIYFIYGHDLVTARKVSDMGLSHAREMGEKFGLLMAMLHKALVLIYSDKMDEFRAFLAECPKSDTGVRKYDYLMSILREIPKAAKVGREAFISRIDGLADDQSDRIDLTRLYKETVLGIVDKRVFKVDACLEELGGSVPNQFKHVFNTFVENYALI